MFKYNDIVYYLSFYLSESYFDITNILLKRLSTEKYLPRFSFYFLR